MDGIQILTIVQQLFTIAASAVVVVGGMRAIQAFSTRLEPSVGGEVRRKNGVLYLTVSVAVANVGIRRQRIYHDATYLILNAVRMTTTGEFDSQEVGFRPVLQRADFLEPVW